HFGAFGLGLGEAALVEFAFILSVTGQGAVDEPYDACAAGAGQVIVRNNLRGDGFDFRGHVRIEEDKLGRGGRVGAQPFGPAGGGEHPVAASDIHSATIIASPKHMLKRLRAACRGRRLAGWQLKARDWRVAYAGGPHNNSYS